MRRLTLVRHSTPEIQPEKPASAWRLSALGRERSELLASRLQDLSPGVVWSSREPKAVETAQIVAASFGVPVQVADGLEEHHRDNVPFFPTADDFESAVERFFDNPGRLVLGSETADQARNRMSAAIDNIVESDQQDSIVVTHGTVMTLYVASIADVDPMCFWRRLGLPSYVVLGLPGNDILSTVEQVAL